MKFQRWDEIQIDMNYYFKEFFGLYIVVILIYFLDFLKNKCVY